MKKIIIISTLLIGVFVGSALLNTASADVKSNTQESIHQVYEMNENGQTFGSAINCTRLEEYPELIQAADSKGTEGYVYFDDLYEYIPSSPEDAALYMEKLCELNEKGVLSKILDNKLSLLFGKYAYSLFIVHPIIIAVFRKTWWHNKEFVTTYPLLTIALTGIASIILAIIVHHNVELPATKFLNNFWLNKNNKTMQ